MMTSHVPVRRIRRMATPRTSDHQELSATNRSTHMTTNAYSSNATANTGAWLTFTYAQFGAAAFMTAVGIWAMPVELMVKGYLMMSAVFLVGSAFTLAKTVRDEHEAKRFAARIDEARTEKLLMEVGRGG